MAFVKVAAVAEIVPGTGKVVQTGGKAVAVFNVGGMFYAIANRCTHMGGPLGEGKVAGTTVTCPWHGSRFDVTSGAVVGPPARQPVKTYPVRIESGNVLIDAG